MKRSRKAIRFARELNPETLQVSLASPYPGTEFYRYVEDSGFLVEAVYNDEAGYQKCTVSYPELELRGDLRRGRAILPQLLLPPDVHLQSGAEDGDQPPRAQAPHPRSTGFLLDATQAACGWRGWLLKNGNG